MVSGPCRGRHAPAGGADEVGVGGYLAADERALQVGEMPGAAALAQAQSDPGRWETIATLGVLGGRGITATASSREGLPYGYMGCTHH